MNLATVFRLAGLRPTRWKITETGPLPGMANIEGMSADIAGPVSGSVGGGQIVLRNAGSHESAYLRYVSAGVAIGAGLAAPLTVSVNVDALPSGSCGRVYAGMGSLWSLRPQDFAGFLDILTLSKDGPVTPAISFVMFNPIPVPIPNPNAVFGVVHFAAWLAGIKALTVLWSLGANLGNLAGVGAELQRGWAKLDG